MKKILKLQNIQVLLFCSIILLSKIFSGQVIKKMMKN